MCLHQDAGRTLYQNFIMASIEHKTLRINAHIACYKDGQLTLLLKFYKLSLPLPWRSTKFQLKNWKVQNSFQ